MVKKFKRIPAMIIAFFITLKNTVFGMAKFGLTDPAKLEPEYGVPSPESSKTIIERFLPMLKFLIIPIILIIGLLIYIKRNKNDINKSQKVKIAKIACLVLLVLFIIAIVFLYFIKSISETL